MALLEYQHYKTLAAHRESLVRLEALMRSAVPDRWKVAFDLKCLREKMEAQAYISTEEAVRVFSGLLRECRLLGPNAQETVLAHLEPLLDRLGLTDAVNRVAEAPRELAGSRGRS
jgi:hypothetical protein